MRQIPSIELVLKTMGDTSLLTAEQDVKWSGMLEHIAVSYQKYVVLIVPLKQSYVLITLEKDAPPESCTIICEAIRALD
jgi:hypothetical protein